MSKRSPPAVGIGPQKRIDVLQRRFNDTAREIASEIDHQGGPQAVDDYLAQAIAHLTNLAIARRGSERACQLVMGALLKAEAWADGHDEPGPAC
jgi:hypothetical protein